MEKHFSYFSVIPLKEMALRRIAVVLVNKPDFLITAEKFPLENARNYRSEWLKTVSSKIKDTASKLLLPESLTSEMIPILKAVGSEIISWISFHKRFVSDMNGDFSARVTKKLCWTTAGTVDYRKTSETLVRSAVLDKLQRCELACFYCLEDYISILWQELSEEDKRTFYNNEDPLENDVPNLQLLLPYILKKHPSVRFKSLAEVRRDPLKYAALSGNQATTEYCLRKFPQANSESSVFETALHVAAELQFIDFTVGQDKKSDVLCYLLSLMTPEEQLRFFKKRPCHVLECFLSWPSHDLSSDIPDVIWTFLSGYEYRSLLIRMERLMEMSGYYLPNIVQKFFLRRPRNFRKEFANDLYLPFFRQFFHAEDPHTIKVVFRILDAADRVRLVFDTGILRLFDDFLLKDSWHLVEVCIREASLSKEEREELREAYAEIALRADRGFESDWKTHKRKRFFEFLDEMDASTGNKRSAEDETATRVKRGMTEMMLFGKTEKLISSIE